MNTFDVYAAFQTVPLLKFHNSSRQVMKTLRPSLMTFLEQLYDPLTAVQSLCLLGRAQRNPFLILRN